MSTNTEWHRVIVSAETARYIRSDEYDLWARIADGEHIFTILRKGTSPGADDGGYMSIAAAVKTKFGIDVRPGI